MDTQIVVGATSISSFFSHFLWYFFPLFLLLILFFFTSFSSGFICYKYVSCRVLDTNTKTKNPHTLVQSKWRDCRTAFSHRAQHYIPVSPSPMNMMYIVHCLLDDTQIKYSKIVWFDRRQRRRSLCYRLSLPPPSLPSSRFVMYWMDIFGLKWCRFNEIKPCAL